MFEYRGYTINVTSGGAFVVDKDDLKISAMTLAKAHELIDLELKSSAAALVVNLPVVGIRQDTLVHTRIVGINRTSSEPRFADKGDLGYVMADTPANVALLREYLGGIMLKSINAKKNNLTQETIRRIRRMIAAVKAEPEFYDQNTCGKRSPQLGGCKTVCCAMGWAVWLDNPKKYGGMMYAWLDEKEVDWLTDVGTFEYEPIFGTAASFPAPFAEDYYWAQTPAERAEVFGRRWEHLIATDGRD